MGKAITTIHATGNPLDKIADDVQACWEAVIVQRAMNLSISLCSEVLLMLD